MSTTDVTTTAPTTDERFEDIWKPPTGFPGFLSTVNQSSIGKWFLVTGFIFFLVGGLLALLMRTQLIVPENTFLSHETYNELFTLHGTTMMFLFAVPILEGFATYLVPHMIGSRDLPFPRLTAFGYWAYLFGGLILYSSLLFDTAPDGAWFMYPPLTSSEFSPGRAQDFWLIGITLTEVAGVVAAIDLIGAIFKLRAPGMTMNRVPIYVWAMLVVAFMILFAFPPLVLADVMLEMERTFNFPFFDASRGGAPELWQHLFWIFGHPEVYIIFLPAAGFISTIIPTFSQRPLVGYTWVVVATVATGFASFGLWVHHMFTTGLPQLSMNFFAAASLTVAIPSGIQGFAWLATLWNGRPIFTTPLLFSLGFLVLFIFGGLSGVTLAVIPFDWQVHDTYYLVAHFHYVLFGGMVFPLFAAFYYWFPNLTGYKLSDTLGQWHFWLVFIGFNVTFFTMHFTGFQGMPRQVYTYPAEMNWGILNTISTIGAYIIGLGILTFVINVIVSLRSDRSSEDNPWNAAELEWSMGLPSPPYNFRSIPEVRSLQPVWEQQGLSKHVRNSDGVLGEPRGTYRETMGTSIADATPEQVFRLPGPSYAPIAAALWLTVALIGVLVKLYWISVVGMLLLTGTIIYWLWPEETSRGELVTVEPFGSLPINPGGRAAPGWWGILLGILSSATAYAYLLVSYLFIRSSASIWPPRGIISPGLLLPVGILFVGLIGAGLAFWGLRSIRQNYPGQARLVLFASAAAALIACLLGVYQIGTFEFTPQNTAYGATVYTVTGYFLLHLLIGLVMSGVSAAKVGRGSVIEDHPLPITVTAMFWAYVALMGAAAVFVLYILPYLW